MTTLRKKMPPIVPQKKPQLQASPGKPSRKVNNTNTSSLESVIAELSLNTTYEVAKPRKNEPQPLLFDDLVENKPVKGFQRFQKNELVINTPVVKPKPKVPVKTKPPVKPKPMLKPKPELKPKQMNLVSETPVVRLSDKQALLNGILQGQLKMVTAGQKPSMVPQPATKRSSNTSSASSSPSPSVTHITKSRSRGPKRRLPSTITDGDPTPLARAKTTPLHTSSNTLDKPTISTNPVGKKQIPPPVPSKSRKIAQLSFQDRTNTI